jgi:hypothetical protein
MILAKGAVTDYAVLISYRNGTLTVGVVKVAARLDRNACHPRFMAASPADRQSKLLF